MRQDRPILGILLMLGFCALAPLADALAKLLGARVGVGELVAWRFLAQSLLLVPIVVWAGERLWLSSRLMWISALRGVLHVVGSFLMFLALRYLPLAETIAIAYVMPFFAIFMGWHFLGETVGPRRVLAAIIGFVGTLMVVQPVFADVGWPALLPLLVAVVFAAFMLVTRAVSHEVGPIRLQAVSGLVSFSLCVPVLILGGSFGVYDLSVAGPPREMLWLYLGLGLIGTLAHLFLVWSLKYAPAATVAPMQYLEIPVATGIGLWLFGAFPNGLALIGIGVTMAAGLWIIWIERTPRRVPSSPRRGSRAEG
jgi:drug/metabolite transporter (DMT)-like permease